MVQIVEPGKNKLGEQLNEVLMGLAQTAYQKHQSQTEKNKQQQLRESGLASLFSPEQAKVLSNLDPELLKPIISEHVKGQRQLESTGPGLKTIAPELNEDEATKIGKLSKGVQNLWYKNYLNSPEQAIKQLRDLPDKPRKQDITNFAKDNQETLMNFSKVSSDQSINQPISDLAQKFTKPSPVNEKLSEEQNIQEFEQEPNQTKSELSFVNEIPKKESDYMKEGYTKAEAKELFKSDIQRIKNDEKESLKYHDKVIDNSTGAEGFNKRLDRMSHLVEKGSLPVAAFYNALEKISEDPIDLKIPLVGPLVNVLTNTVLKSAGGIGRAVQKNLTSRDYEEFEKLTNDFVRDAKNFYGNRITNTELEQFLKMIPSLSQTDHGKRAVIRNMKNFNDAIIKQKEVMTDLINKNKGRRPTNLALLVDQRMKEYKDRSAKDYIEGISNLQNEIIELPWQQVFSGPIKES